MFNKELASTIGKMEFGIYGPPVPVTGTSEVLTPNAFCFWVLQDNTRIASITINGTDITAYAAIDLKANTPIYGVITKVTLSAGSGIAYVGNNNID